MSREEIIKYTIKAIESLPETKAMEIADFAEFVLKKYEEQVFSEGLKKIISDSKAYEFLKDEDDIYTVKDLKEKYK